MVLAARRRPIQERCRSSPKSCNSAAPRRPATLYIAPRLLPHLAASSTVQDVSLHPTAPAVRHKNLGLLPFLRLSNSVLVIPCPCKLADLTSCPSSCHLAPPCSSRSCPCAFYVHTCPQMRCSFPEELCRLTAYTSVPIMISTFHAL